MCTKLYTHDDVFSHIPLFFFKVRGSSGHVERWERVALKLLGILHGDQDTPRAGRSSPAGSSSSHILPHMAKGVPMQTLHLSVWSRFRVRKTQNSQPQCREPDSMQVCVVHLPKVTC